MLHPSPTGGSTSCQATTVSPEIGQREYTSTNIRCAIIEVRVLRCHGRLFGSLVTVFGFALRRPLYLSFVRAPALGMALWSVIGLGLRDLGG